MKTKQQIQERIEQLTKSIDNVTNHLKTNPPAEVNQQLIKLLSHFQQRLSALQWVLT